MKPTLAHNFFPWQQTPRYLIADRDPVVREYARRMLTARGFEVSTAADGLQCLTQLREEAPTVLVLDPHIPWGGGDGVLDWLREESPVSPLKILLVVSKDGEVTKECLKSLVSKRLKRPRNRAETPRTQLSS